jgi:kelch motif-containing protein
MKVLRTLGIGLFIVLALASVGFSQTWTALKNQPSFAPNDALLLTDGRIIVQDTNAPDWWVLTPDSSGSYVNGTWKSIASLQSGYQPLYHTAAVLPDGRLVIQGGEYNGGGAVWTNQGSIYDPLKNKWTPLTPPAGWSQIGDCQSVVLTNGTLMIGDPFDQADAQFNAQTRNYKVLTGTGKSDRNDEEGWLLLPNGQVLTTDAINSPNSELFNPKTQKWSTGGSTIVHLADPGSQEIGPMVLRPDGTVFATGASTSTGHTAIYNTKTKKWKAGPDFQSGLDIADGPAALLPDGNVLVMTSPGVFNPGVQFFEWTGKKLVNAPNIAGASSIPSFVGDMVVLPTGQVLLTTQGNTATYIYTAKGSSKSAWAPTITAAPSSVTRGSTYKISGTQFNGLSQGAAYGDDTQSATNYPLVRITNNGTSHVFYARTHGHSTMAVATGTKRVSTNFDVPSGMETGASSLVVVANGIASASVAVTVN